MCGGGPSIPAPVDYEAQRRQAEIEAEQAAGANAARTKRARRMNSLLATGGDGVGGSTATSSALALGKSTLGGA